MGRRLPAGILGLALSLSPAWAGALLPADLLAAVRLAAYDPPLAAPDFTGETASGDALSLASLRGRVVVITFWASWCAECRPEMPQFDALHREFGPDGLTVLGVNVQETRDAIGRYADMLDLTFPLVVDAEGAIRRAYGVIGLPTSFLVDREGLVVARAVGARDWSRPEARTLVRHLLAAP